MKESTKASTRASDTDDVAVEDAGATDDNCPAAEAETRLAEVIVTGRRGIGLGAAETGTGGVESWLDCAGDGVSDGWLGTRGF